MRKIPIPKAKIDPVYNSWNILKKKLAKNKQAPHIKEGEVWWCAMGQNLGTEIYGKGKTYARPILIFKIKY